MTGRRDLRPAVGRLLTAGLLIAATAAPLAAQSAGTPSAAAPRLAISVGPEWSAPVPMGGVDATLTRNGGSGPYTLFRTESELSGGLGPSASLAVRLAGGLWAEVTSRYHSAELETRVSGDVEAAPAAVREGVQQIQVEAGALWLPDRLRMSRALRLHAVAGGGWLRQLHASNTLGQNGRSYYAGGGVIVGLPQRQGGTFKQAGLRLEVRAAFVQDGVAFDDAVHAAPAVWTALFLRF